MILINDILKSQKTESFDTGRRIDSNSRIRLHSALHYLITEYKPFGFG